MAKNIQIRNVPEAAHRKLTRRAAQAGMSLSELLLPEISHYASLPTPDEMQERLRTRPETKLSESAATLVRRERDST